MTPSAVGLIVIYAIISEYGTDHLNNRAPTLFYLIG